MPFLHLDIRNYSLSSQLHQYDHQWEIKCCRLGFCHVLVANYFHYLKGLTFGGEITLKTFPVFQGHSCRPEASMALGLNLNQMMSLQ